MGYPAAASWQVNKLTTTTLHGRLLASKVPLYSLSGAARLELINHGGQHPHMGNSAVSSLRRSTCLLASELTNNSLASSRYSAPPIR